MLKELQVFFDSTFSWIKSSMSLNSWLEIIILAVCIYYILSWFQKTQTWTLLKGLLMCLLMMAFAYFFQLNVILTIIQSAFNVGITALLILFQPELRRGLEQLGRRNLSLGKFLDDSGKNNRFSDETKEAIVKACFSMSAVKTGALIVLEQKTPLGEYEKTGIPMDALISSQLLEQVFEHNTPLHDGAVIVRGDRITAATCYLPVSKNMTISKVLGTRHRAGLGISEVSDCVCIIVSEETGNVSVAQEGTLRRNMTPNNLTDLLTSLQKQETVAKKFRLWKGRRRDENIDE